MLNKNNIDKRLESTSDGSVAKELMQLAEEKDPYLNIDLVIMSNLEQAYEEAKEAGYKGTLSDYIKETPVEELKKLAFNDGGLVDFSNLTPGQLKAIFRSENGRDPTSIKELVRGVKMYLKNLDIDGIPIDAFGRKD